MMIIWSPLLDVCVCQLDEFGSKLKKKKDSVKLLCVR